MKLRFLALSSIGFILLGSYLVLFYPYPSNLVTAYLAILLYSGLSLFIVGVALGFITIIMGALRTVRDSYVPKTKKNRRDLIFWYFIGGLPGLILGARQISKEQQSPEIHTTQYLKIGISSSIVGTIAWDLVDVVQSVAIPEQLIPSELVSHPSSTFESVFIPIAASFFLVWIFGIAFVVLYNKIPTRNAVSKSLILSLTFMLVIAGIQVLSSAWNSIYLLLFGLMYNMPRYVVLGVTMGFVFKKLKGRVDNKKSLVERGH